MRKICYTLLAAGAALAGLALLRPDLSSWQEIVLIRAPRETDEGIAPEATSSASAADGSAERDNGDESPGEASATVGGIFYHLPSITGPMLTPTILKATDASSDPPAELAPAVSNIPGEPTERTSETKKPTDLPHDVAGNVDAVISERRGPDESTTTPIGTGLIDLQAAARPQLDGAAPLEVSSSATESNLASSPLPASPPLAGPDASMIAPGAVSAASELLTSPRTKVVVHPTQEPDPAPVPDVVKEHELLAKAAPVDLGTPGGVPAVSKAETATLPHDGTRTDGRDSTVMVAPAPAYAQATDDAVADQPARKFITPAAGDASSPKLNVVRPTREALGETSPTQALDETVNDAWRRRWQSFLGSSQPDAPQEDLSSDRQLPGDTQLPTSQLQLGQEDTVSPDGQESLTPQTSGNADLPGDNETPVVTRDSLTASDEAVPQEAVPQEALPQEALPGLSRLPQTDNDDASFDLSDDANEQDIVLHAGGTVRLRPPLGWHVSEVAAGRQMRLLITPKPVDAQTVDPRDGCWLVCHVRPSGVVPPEEELLAMLPFRVAGGKRPGFTAGPLEHLAIDKWPAVQQSFSIHSPATATAGESALAEISPLAEVHLGFHLLVRTTWGLVEAHVEVPDNKLERLRQLDAMVREIKLAPPRPAPVATLGHVMDASPILGSWKSYKGRFRFYPDGSVSLAFDRKGVYAMDKTGKANLASRLNQQTGHFTAKGNVLRIVWNDGSKLNLRWREHDAQLLLTDHTGQTSRLARLLE